MEKNTKWVTFMSQTGSEIARLSCALGRKPDFIVINTSDLSNINEWVLENAFDRIICIPDKPSLEDYETLLNVIGTEDILITLHGYLRIIPKELCEKHAIYNGHPGLIVPGIYIDPNMHLNLRGFDPQKKAKELNLGRTGAVIHKVTTKVDEGPIISYKILDGIQQMTLEELIKELKDISYVLWYEFLANTL